MKRIYLIIFGLLFCLSCNSQTEISEESNIVKHDNHTYFDTFNKNLISNNEIVKLRVKELVFLELLIKG